MRGKVGAAANYLKNGRTAFDLETACVSVRDGACTQTGGG